MIVGVTEILNKVRIVVPNYPQRFGGWMCRRFQMERKRRENLFCWEPLEGGNINPKRAHQIRFFPFLILPEDRGKFSIRNLACSCNHKAIYSVPTFPLHLRPYVALCS